MWWLFGEYLPTQSYRSAYNIVTLSSPRLPGAIVQLHVRLPAGGLVIKAVVEAQLPVNIVPGPNAATSALLVSGFDPSKFSFMGFLPAKGGPRRRVL